MDINSPKFWFHITEGFGTFPTRAMIQPLAPPPFPQTFARVKVLEPSELSAEARRYRDGETHQAAPGGRRGKTTSRRVKF